MRATGYPEYGSHKEAHDAFAAQLLELESEYRAKGPVASLVKSVNGWVGEWLQVHTAGSDRLLGRYLTHVSPFFGRRDGRPGGSGARSPQAEVELRESAARPEIALTRLELRLRA